MLTFPRECWRGRLMFDANLPWLVPESIMVLDAILKRTMRVLEFGSGGSTVFFADRAGVVASFEHDSAWAEKVKNRLSMLKLYNVRQFDASSEAAIHAGLKEVAEYCPKFDVVLIDAHPVQFPMTRTAIAGLVKPLLAENSIVVIDNYSRHTGAVEQFDEFGKVVFDHPAWQGQGTMIVFTGAASQASGESS